MTDVTISKQLNSLKKTIKHSPFRVEAIATKCGYKPAQFSNILANRRKPKDSWSNFFSKVQYILTQHNL